ncbi:MAG: histidine kinase [Nocardioides sp.]
MDRALPEQYQPEITLAGRLWRLVGMLVMSSIFWSWAVQDQWQHQRYRFWIDIAVGISAYVLVNWRRRFPLSIALLLNVSAGVSALAGGPALLAAVSVATRRYPREIIPLSLVILSASMFFKEYQHIDAGEIVEWEAFLITVAFVLIQIGWGLYIGSRREMYFQLRRRAEQAEAERDERIGRAREQERARIAREMHDVLAHRITQMSMLSGAMAVRTDLDADALRKVAVTLQHTAASAIDDLRGVLGVLRDPASGQQLTPQPTYQDVRTMVDDWRRSGANVHLNEDITTDGADVPDPLGRAVYRIVQEGLTNAARHAPGSRVSITVTGGPGSGLTVRVTNPEGFRRADTSGSRLGLIGLRERAQLSGGRLTHTSQGGQFVLEGWLPWGT